MDWLDRFIRLDLGIAKRAMTSFIVTRQGIETACESLLSGQQKLIDQQKLSGQQEYG